MQIVEQVLQFVQQGIAFAFKYIKMVWGWSTEQIESLPWQNPQHLEYWQMGVLAVASLLIIYLLYSSIRELLEAGQKALIAFVTLLTVLIKTLLPLFLAGLVAAGGAWIINNIHNAPM
jgi:hypothetical protein